MKSIIALGLSLLISLTAFAGLAVPKNVLDLRDALQLKLSTVASTEIEVRTCDSVSGDWYYEDSIPANIDPVFCVGIATMDDTSVQSILGVQDWKFQTDGIWINIYPADLGGGSVSVHN